MSFGSSMHLSDVPTITHIVKNVHNLHFASNRFETFDQLTLNQFLDDPINGLLQ